MASLDFRTIIQKLHQQQWRVERTANGHFKAVPPTPGMAIVHFSESAEPRSVRNTISDLRKSGFVWDDAPASPRLNVLEKPLVKLGELAPAIASLAAPPSPSPSPPPPTLDGLFAALKEAKAYADLAAEHVAETQRELRDAQQAAEEARDEHAKACEQLAAAKRAFTEAFDAPQAPAA